VRKVKARVHSPCPVHSRIFSVIAEISTGSHPIASISSMRFSLDYPEDIVGPCGIAGQAEEAHQSGPRFLASVAQQKCSPGAPARMKFLRYRQQVPNGSILATPSSAEAWPAAGGADGVLRRRIPRASVEPVVCVPACCVGGPGRRAGDV
jgi:hypothetical protein